MMGNSTTIEGWEKDKAATLVRRGKIREIKFPYNLGSKRKNIEAVLGKNPLLWCWPTVTPGTGLRYPLAAGDDLEDAAPWPPADPYDSRIVDETNPNYEFTLPASPWTYDNESVNPNLQATNSRLRTQSQRRKPPTTEPISSVPPYHPDYRPPGIVATTSPRHDQESSGSEMYDDEEDDYTGKGKRTLVRRGSEGYEVRPVDREEMLRRYLDDRGEEPDRYQRYVPEPPSESESGEDDDDETPLGNTRTT